jgi:hypothetical protein
LTTEEGAFIDGKIAMISQEPVLPPGEQEGINEPNPQPEPPVFADVVQQSARPEPPPPSAGMGATEQDSDEVFEQTGDAPEDAEVENISEGHEGELPVGGDWTEGQTHTDFEEAPPESDTPRQST